MASGDLIVEPGPAIRAALALQQQSAASIRGWGQTIAIQVETNIDPDIAGGGDIGKQVMDRIDRAVQDCMALAEAFADNVEKLGSGAQTAIVNLAAVDAEYGEALRQAL